MLDAGFLNLQDLKTRILPDGQESRSEWDVDLRDLGKGVAEAFNNHCNRVFQRVAGATYDVPANRSSLCLDAAPVESVDSVVLVTGGLLGDREDITANSRSFGAKSGIIDFGYVLGSYMDRVEVVFTGGYWLDDGQAMPPDATALPADVLSAYVRQCQTTAEKTELFHTSGLRRSDDKNGGSSLDQLDLIPDVIRILSKYTRYA